jgi:hypothetical protein
VPHGINNFLWKRSFHPWLAETEARFSHPVAQSGGTGGIMMLGIEDPQIIFGYALAIVLAAVSVIYGVLNWNRGGGEDG